jgi:hypothetical protein
MHGSMKAGVPCGRAPANDERARPEPSRDVAAGPAILVACPPAPLMTKATPNLGKGSAALMTCLHLSLATLAFFTVPIGLYLQSIALGFHADVDLLKMAIILGSTILIPAWPSRSQPRTSLRRKRCRWWFHACSNSLPSP